MPANELANLTFITGGARSGKSTFAEKSASEKSDNVIYIATLVKEKNDSEVCERIDIHRARRSAQWATLEIPLNVHEAVASLPNQPIACILDCVSIYVSNIILEKYHETSPYQSFESKVEVAVEQLLQAISEKDQISFFLVSNEVGSGIVPDNRLSRIYRDVLGITNQRLARAANNAWLCASGLQLRLKSSN